MSFSRNPSTQGSACVQATHWAARQPLLKLFLVPLPAPGSGQAEAICSNITDCLGFTYDSKEQNLTGATKMYFKKTRYCNLDPTWSS